jgi:hypothetical protein
VRSRFLKQSIVEAFASDRIQQPQILQKALGIRGNASVLRSRLLSIEIAAKIFVGVQGVANRVVEKSRWQSAIKFIFRDTHHI